MEIVKKITQRNGSETIGYIVRDGMFDLALCNNALYTSMYILPLIEAGYKYYNHNANDIDSPDGTPISQLPGVELSDVDPMEWFSSVDLANEQMLDDASAAKYYSYKKDNKVEFKTESSYEINTREEFLDYLREVKNALYTVSYCTDNRPINSFVNPDALFTIKELEDSPELKEYFSIIIKRHHFRDYTAYTSLCKWLVSKGVLNTETPTMAEFLSAYYAWGPEGLKDDCISCDVKMNVDGNFLYIKDPLGSTSAESRVFDNRVSKVSVIDSQGDLHFLRHTTPTNHISDLKDFGRDRIMVSDSNALFMLRRATNTGKKYTAVANTLVSDVSDRLYMTLISESGYNYVYKVAHNQMKIGLAFSESSASVFSTTDNFAVSTIIPAVSVTLDNISNATDYYLWNLAILKSAQVMRNRTFKAPVSSTTEFLLNDGVNPVAVIDMIAHSLNKGGFTVNRKYMLSNKDDDMNDALELYLKDIPPYLLAAFNLSEEDIEDGINSFLELADVDDLRDRREAMMAKRIGPGDAGFDPTYKDYQTKFGKNAALLSQASALMGKQVIKYDAIDYYMKLKFVHDCLHGGVSVNNLGDGLLNDLGASYKLAAECILSVIYAEYGVMPNKDVAKDAILNLENSTLIDINKIFRIRDAALKGYKVDFAEYRKTRACGNTWIWAYCTKVFREISNAPIEKQRPYLMELVTLDNSKPDVIVRQLMTECVKVSLKDIELSEKPFGDEDTLMGLWNDRKCAENSAEYIAARLFYFVLSGGCKSEPVNDNYIIDMEVYNNQTVSIKLPVNVYNFIKSFDIESHKRYITVYDYCKYEYNPNTSVGTFNICLVNANVDPWHVKPKKGYKIKSYSLLPNYYEANTLDNANGEGFYLTAKDNKEIIVPPLKGLYRNLFLPTSELSEIIMYEDEVRTSNDPSDLESFMLPNQCEYIFAYVKRWALERKRANAMGKTLISIPLKQDIVYYPMAHAFCDEYPATSPVYSDDQSFNDKKCQKDTGVLSISWRDYYDVSTGISAKQKTIREFSILDLDINAIEEFDDVLFGSTDALAPVYITGNYINIKDDTMLRVPVTRLTDNNLQELVSTGVLKKISDNKYFIRAINGDYILEV